MFIDTATVNTFLYLLENHPDTLIIRKSGLEPALMVSKQASKILQHEGVSSSRGLKLTKELDDSLQAKMGQMNPGTTADLIAGTIFCALLFGVRY